MKFFSSLFLLFALTSSLFATQTKTTMYRIIITKTKNKENLPLIYEDLRKQGIKQYVNKKNAEYYIYSQEFTSKSKAQQYLQRVKRRFPSAKILQKNLTKNNPLTKTKLSIGLNAALAAIDANEMKYGYEGGFTLRYNFNKNIFTSLDLTYSKIDSFKLYNSYVAINYLFDSNIFIGMKGGYSILDVTNFSQSKTYLAGGNIGYKYPINNDFDLMFQYSLLYGEHILQYSQSDELKINYFHSLSLIINYNIY